MSRLTTDPTDPDLTRGVDAEPTPQAAAYLVLDAAEIAKGYVRPFRRSYQHTTCGVVTRMSAEIAATYARDPGFYGATYCVRCQRHLPVAEFTWTDNPNQTVGS